MNVKGLSQPIPSSGMNVTWQVQEYGNLSSAILPDGVQISGSYDGSETIPGSEGFNGYTLISDLDFSTNLVFSVNMTIDSVVGTEFSSLIGIQNGSDPIDDPDLDYIAWGSYFYSGSGENSVGFYDKTVGGVHSRFAVDPTDITTGRTIEYKIVVSGGTYSYYIDGELKYSESAAMDIVRPYMHTGIKYSGTSISVRFEGVFIYGDAYPRVNLTTPLDGEVTNVPVVTVSGTSARAVQLSVNGFLVNVGLDGNFSIPLPLVNGVNLIVANAVDSFGNSATDCVNVTFVDPAPALAQQLAALEDELNQTNLRLNLTSGTMLSVWDILNGTIDRLGLLEAQVLLTESSVSVVWNLLNSTIDNVLYLQGQMSATQSNIAVVSNLLNSTADTLANVVAELDVTRDTLVTVWATLNGTIDEVVVAKGEIDFTKTMVTEVWAILNSTNSDLAQLQLDKALIEQDVDLLSDKSLLMEDNISDLSADLNTVVDDLSGVSHNLSEASILIEGLRADIQNTGTNLSDAKDDIGSLRTEINSLRTQILIVGVVAVILLCAVCVLAVTAWRSRRGGETRS
jgi:hypothetical protein